MIIRNNQRCSINPPFLLPDRTSVIQAYRLAPSSLPLARESRDIIEKMVHVASILEGRVVGIRGGGGVAGGAFSTVRARQAITLDACRPPLFSYRSRGPPAALLNTASPPHPISTLSWRRAEPKTLTLPSLPRIEGCDYARHRFKCTLFPPFFLFPPDFFLLPEREEEGICIQCPRLGD